MSLIQLLKNTEQQNIEEKQVYFDKIRRFAKDNQNYRALSFVKYYLYLASVKEVKLLDDLLASRYDLILKLKEDPVFSKLNLIELLLYLGSYPEKITYPQISYESDLDFFKLIESPATTFIHHIKKYDNEPIRDFVSSNLENYLYHLETHFTGSKIGVKAFLYQPLSELTDIDFESLQLFDREHIKFGALLVRTYPTPEKDYTFTLNARQFGQLRNLDLFGSYFSFMYVFSLLIKETQHKNQNLLINLFEIEISELLQYRHIFTNIHDVDTDLSFKELITMLLIVLVQRKEFTDFNIFIVLGADLNLNLFTVGEGMIFNGWGVITLLDPKEESAVKHYIDKTEKIIASFEN